ncbi:MAG: DUF5056 domain-containing protein [Phocaeicola sp.]|uniref:DUF5056 domain-containing protein n=1 Tax=Phocaeicola sp. TaxID=2773926 RepID=UPI0023BCE13C|nr:DUF5056 domain-containing protein [Phocaeicola sp.]MDE5677811.1 DUF5056 domain-containing protein [Phocaeicola sp.]MDE6181115.1 DUF5056 domain-containing protein [Phocaeicola sp.]
MMENDDQLIKNFLLAGKQEIEDNGFSRRVIRLLPQRAQWLSDLLSMACTVACCILFYIFNGVEVLFRTINETITSQAYYQASNISSQSLYLAAAVLILVGLQRACSLKW